MKAWALLLLVGTAHIYAQSTQPQSKEALLIANGNYEHFGVLYNPHSDAQLLSTALQKIGFHVSLIENASREGMLDALQAFQDRLKSSHGIALFHYGGHGVQVNGRNYLIPVEADIPEETKVTTRAVDLEEVMTTLGSSGSDVNIVILDACRDNPLPATASRSASRGLSVVQTKPKNSLVVYAAEPGSKAEDGLFTPTLAEVITDPRKSISQILREVRKLVLNRSKGSQTTGEYDQLIDDVYLNNNYAQGLEKKTEVFSESIRQTVDQLGLQNTDLLLGPNCSSSLGPINVNGSPLGIVSAKLLSGEDGSKKLLIAIKAGIGESIEVPQVQVQVYFYDQDGVNGDVFPSKAQVTSSWMSRPVSWKKKGEPELLQVSYLPDKTDPMPKFAGYVVAVYYRGDLQDYRSEPSNLQKKFSLKYYIGLDE